MVIAGPGARPARRPLPSPLLVAARPPPARPRAHAAPALDGEPRAPAMPPEIARLNDSIHSTAERLKPALVQIRVRRARGRDGRRGRAAGHRRRSAAPRARASSSARTAIIVTNEHVVDGAERIQVKLHDGRRFEAR